MKRCNKCLLPETHETIEFDKSGDCNICQQHEIKKEKIDWNVRNKELMILFIFNQELFMIKIFYGKMKFNVIDLKNLIKFHLM